jgi:DMSO/TMAO reductase YedYZ molybdopterin-dependent catalytic subunit/thiosulfate reductase cytochrome b subunit
MPILDFPIWLRATHFLNLLFISLLVRSGFEILSAHPKLYWNDDCTPGSEWLRFTRRKMPEHELWTSRDEEESFSSWIALPGRKNLGLGRHWHFLADAGWLLTGVLYVVMLCVTPEWRRLIPTSWAIIPGAAHALLTYLSFHLVVTPGHYNPLEQLAYFSVVFLLSPLAIATGLAMSPSIAARHPWYIRIFHGRQAARSIHFLCLCAYLAFFAVHLTMVILHGEIAEMGLIVLGDVRDVHGSLGLIVGLAGLGGVIVIHIVATWYSLKHPRLVQRRTEVLLDPLRRTLFGRGVSAQHYTRSEISPYFRVNGRPPADADYAAMARENFASFVLEVDGLVEQPLRATLAELRSWPRRTQITKHNCIQGWSAVASWSGVTLTEVMRRCRPLPAARYLVFYALDDKSTSEPDPAGPGRFYGTISVALASHPQTILAYDMNDSPLPVPHGAPLRVRVETQLGFTMVKYVRRIEFVHDYRHIGAGQGGWREDHQYYSQEAGI